MHYLVTGGAGFIGFHLAKRLVADGHAVTIVDSVNDYYDPTLKEARLKQLGDTVSVLRVDITDQAALREVFAQHRFDAIAHSAAQAGVRYSLAHPEVYVASNYVGTFNLLELAKQHGIKKLVLASTSSVYGTSTDMPFNETDPAWEPMSIYAATKRGTEFLAATYSHLYDMDIMCLRFFTVYGPWGRPDMALFLFTEKILAGKPITVFNNGEMRRDFTYVDDIVNGFVLALQSTRSGFHIYNLGNGQPVNLIDFIRVIEQELGQEAVKDFQPLQPGDVPETAADISKAREELGYNPMTKVETGVKQFLEWYRDYN